MDEDKQSLTACRGRKTKIDLWRSFLSKSFQDGFYFFVLDFYIHIQYIDKFSTEIYFIYIGLFVCLCIRLLSKLTGLKHVIQSR